MTARTCTVPECGRRHYGRGYCRAHHARWRRHGDPAAARQLGTKTSGGVSYWSVHERLRTERGPASSHRCAECGAAALGWSYDGADPDERTDPARGYRYSLDLARYRPRCRCCHRRATVAAHPGTPVLLDADRIARLYRAGATARGIAALLGTSPHIVLTTLRAHDVPIRNRDYRPTAQDQKSDRARQTTTTDSTRTSTTRTTDSTSKRQSTTTQSDDQTIASRSDGGCRVP